MYNNVYNVWISQSALTLQSAQNIYDIYICIYVCVCVFVCYINVPGMLPRHLKAESHSETQVAQTPCQGTRSGTRPHLKWMAYSLQYLTVNVIRCADAAGGSQVWSSHHSRACWGEDLDCRHITLLRHYMLRQTYLCQHISTVFQLGVVVCVCVCQNIQLPF